MDKHVISERIEQSILNRVRGLLTLIPNTLSYHNTYMFETICNRIDRIVADAYIEADALGCSDVIGNWRRRLVPYCELHEIKDIAAWHDFISCVLANDCTVVKVERDVSIPRITFDDLTNQHHFSVVLEIV